MSAAPKNTIDINGLSLAHKKTPIDSIKKTPRANNSREVLKDVLADLTEPDVDVNNTDAGQVVLHDAASEAKYEELMKAFNSNHTFSSVREDTRGYEDITRYPLYLEGFPVLLKELLASLEIRKSSNLERKRLNGEDLNWDDQISLRNPEAAIQELLRKSQGKDVTRADLASSYTTIKVTLKRFFEDLSGWMTDKPVVKLKIVEEKLGNVLAVLDSLKTIVERSPLNYPNRDILNQEKPVPAYTTAENPVTWSEKKAKQKPTTWKDVSEMFAPVIDAAEPFAETKTGRNENEDEIWGLHTSLASRFYQDLCRQLAVDPSSEVIDQLKSLANNTVKQQENTQIIETIISLLQAQVKEAQRTEPLNSNLFEAKISLRSVIEQLNTLKEVANRNIPGIKGVFARAKHFGTKMYHRLQGWFKPKDQANKSFGSSFFDKIRSFKTLGLIAGLASLTSFSSGESHNPETNHRPEPAPIAVTPESPVQQEAPVSTQGQASTAEESLTEPIHESSEIAQLSIQRRLQNTFKGQAALSTFRTLYAHLPITISEKQETYLANTFAHIVRPHLRGFHSNTDTAPLHVTYLGSAPHHKHVFMVNSAGHSETIRIHIPSWESIARGLAHADAPVPHHEQPTIPVYTGPNDMESELASLVPPPPPGASAANIHSAVEIDAALDALNQADQLPPTPVVTPTIAPSRPAPATPHAVAIALDELAQSDRNKNRSA